MRDKGKKLSGISPEGMKKQLERQAMIIPPGVKIDTKLDSLSWDDIVCVAESFVEYVARILTCGDRFDISIHKDVDKSTGHSAYCMYNAVYDKFQIYIDCDLNEDIEELLNALLHEMSHYLTRDIDALYVAAKHIMDNESEILNHECQKCSERIVKRVDAFLRRHTTILNDYIEIVRLRKPLLD